jgi:hypothetical protein
MRRKPRTLYSFLIWFRVNYVFGIWILTTLFFSIWISIRITSNTPMVIHAVSFWTENLTEVLIWYFPKTEIPFVMQIETQVLKNKVFKTQWPKTYLALWFITFFYFSLDLKGQANMTRILFVGVKTYKTLQDPI